MARSMVATTIAGGLNFLDNTTSTVSPNATMAINAEALTQYPVRDAGTFSMLYTYSSANTASVTSTITLRKSLSNTTITVSYTSDQTGIKQDTTHTSTFAATDELDYVVVVPTEAGTNNLTLNVIKCEFSPTTVTDCISFVRASNSSLSTASTDTFIGISGRAAPEAQTEANVKFRIRESFTASDFYTTLSTNTRTTDTVYRTRVNGANGNQSTTYTSTQTGIKEDTSNNDTLVAGDDFNYSATTGTGTGTISGAFVSVSLINTSSFSQLGGVRPAGSAISFNTTTYIPVTSECLNSTEASVEMLPQFDVFIASELGVFVSANTIATSATTVALRDNGSTSALTVSYAAGQTGLKNDSVNSVKFDGGTDEISYQVVTPNTSGSITFNWVGVLGFNGIQFDAASNSGYKTASSSYTWSHTCTGRNTYLLVGVSMLSVAGSSVSSITYNSVAMTFLGARASVSGAVRIELWGLVNPSSGSNTVAVTLSASLDSAAGAVSYIGVHQTLSTEGFASDSATNVGAADATVNVTTIATNDWVIGAVATDDTAITADNGTSRWNVTGTLGSGAGSDSDIPWDPPDVVTTSWVDVGALATWSTAGIAIRPLFSSGPTPVSSSSTTQFFQLLGLGT